MKSCVRSGKDATAREDLLDAVNHPKHYQGKSLESIEVIEDFELGFHLGNAIKYILRSGKKRKKIQDLKKAIWYLERECANGVVETPDCVEET